MTAHSLRLIRFRIAAYLFVSCAMLLSGPMAPGALAQEAGQADAQALDRLGWMPKNQTGMLNVNSNEGAFLRDQVIKVKAKHALEVGTSNGYSSIWIALGVRQSGGHLTTLEIDPVKVKLATENFRIVGVDSLITLMPGDALKTIPTLKGPFEFVFIDAWKQDYVKYLDMVLPLVPPGGVIMAHNVTDLRSQLLDFIERVKTDPRLKTTFADPGPGGFSVSVKLPAK